MRKYRTLYRYCNVFDRLCFVGLVPGHDLLDELVDAARILELDLGPPPVEVLQLAEHRDVALEADVEAFQLVAQLLTHVCVHQQQ